MSKIKELRKQCGYSQARLAELLSTTQTNVSGWELGKWQPDNETLRAMAKIFNVTTDYLLGVTPDSTYTATDYANGVTDTQKENITAVEMLMLNTFRQIGAECGEQAQERAIEILKLVFIKGE